MRPAGNSTVGAQSRSCGASSRRRPWPRPRSSTGLSERYDLREVPGEILGSIRQCHVESIGSQCCNLDDNTLDHPRQPRHQLLLQDFLWSVRGSASADGNWAKKGDRYILADKLADTVMESAKVEAFARVADADPHGLVCDHPLSAMGYSFEVPLLDGDHVTDDTGTGFVHTAPGHGADDYNISGWRRWGSDTLTPSMPMAISRRKRPVSRAPRHYRQGREGGCERLRDPCLADAGALIARGRLKHQYPHSWRSKKPIIFATRRNGSFPCRPMALRDIALRAIDDTAFYPPAGQNRLRAYDRAAARLGHLAPARLGRAHCRFRHIARPVKSSMIQSESAYR